MWRTCSYCGKLHKHDYICNKRPSKRKKYESQANTVRDGYKWRLKREEIKARDGYKCLVCYAGKYLEHKGQQYAEKSYIKHDQLEVHHVDVLECNIEKAYDNDHLMTMCCYHHKMADRGAIPRDEQMGLIKKSIERYNK